MSPPPETSPSAAAARTRDTLLVGNPNVGKSMLFGLLTGRYTVVSNYPGTTVEVTRGKHRVGGAPVVDTPGTYTLIPNTEDEGVARDMLLEHLADGGDEVLLVVDAKNLSRGVSLALQVGEIDLPVVIVANMLDEARSRGVELDLGALARELGVEVVGTVATERRGTAPLVAREVAFRPVGASVTYDDAIEDAIREVSALLPADLPGKRGISIMLLVDDPSRLSWASRTLGDGIAEVERIRADLARRLPEPASFAVSKARIAAANVIAKRVRRRCTPAKTSLATRFGDLAMHPLWGLPVAAVVLWVVYLFVGVLGAGHAAGFLENVVFAEYVVPWTDAGLRAVLPASVETLLVGAPGTEIGTGPGLVVGDYGLVSMALSASVALVLPIVGAFFFAFSLLEDSGYLPRLAVMLDRIFKRIGLNGKAVLPMILGLGCGTMATMTVRILQSRKERILVTLLLALGVPCSAQLGVILGMLAALDRWAVLTWACVVVATMLVVGWAASKVLPGHGGDFILEVPPIRRPALGNVLVKTLVRMQWYLREAVPLFLLGTFVLWLLERVGLLDAIRGAASPLVEGVLELPSRATDAFLVGLFRRDYAAAGLHEVFADEMANGAVTADVQVQVVVAMVTITLFMPCIANVFVIAKQRGWKTALAISAFIIPCAFLVGGALNLGLRVLLT